MRTHRAAVSVAIAVCLMLASGLAPTARAQGNLPLALRLTRQTPWNTPKDPTVKIAVTAHNTGPTSIGGLSVVLTLGSALHTLDGYEASMTAGPATPIKLQATTFDGSIGPGQVRTFEATLDLSGISPILLTPIDSLVYPLRVELRSTDVTVGELRTPVVYLARTPEVPLTLQWTFELAAPIGFDPSGHFVDASLELAVAKGGRIANEIAAIAAVVAERQPKAVTVVISPLLLDQLARMRDGYSVGTRTVAAGQGGAADAATALATLRRIAADPSVEFTAEPFAAPSLPAMYASGLGHDVTSQVVRGRAIATDLLGASPSGSVVRPPGGALDDAAVNGIANGGGQVVLGNADTVARPPVSNGFAPPPTGALEVNGGGSIPVILPDPNMQAVITSPTSALDPVLAAQIAAGELVQIWKEQPSTTRGVAVFLPSTLPGGFWLPFARRISTAPWVDPVSATSLANDLPPQDVSALANPSTASFSHDYAVGIKQERRRIGWFSSMLVKPSPVPDRLEADLLYAESGQFVGHESAGNAFTDAANRVTAAAFSAVSPDTSQGFTLTSRSGTIPLRMGDPGQVPLKVVVQLESATLRFPQGGSKTVVLDHPQQIVSFPVEVTSSGSFTVTVVVRSPSGREIAQSNLVIRSTAYNRIALILTLAAGLALVALWSRRFFRRRTT
jgi:hypothetical protein